MRHSSPPIHTGVLFDGSIPTRTGHSTSGSEGTFQAGGVSGKACPPQAMHLFFLPCSGKSAAPLFPGGSIRPHMFCWTLLSCTSFPLPERTPGAERPLEPTRPFCTGCNLFKTCRPSGKTGYQAPLARGHCHSPLRRRRRSGSLKPPIPHPDSCCQYDEDTPPASWKPAASFSRGRGYRRRVSSSECISFQVFIRLLFPAQIPFIRQLRNMSFFLTRIRISFGK